jgi:hypothetical protein
MARKYPKAAGVPFLAQIRSGYGISPLAHARHTDEPRPHVHVVLKAVSEQGRWLNIKKATLQEWRVKFAAHLREQGVAANATPRRFRNQRVRATPHALLVPVGARAAGCGAATAGAGAGPSPLTNITQGADFDRIVRLLSKIIAISVYNSPQSLLFTWSGANVGRV